MGEKRGNAGIGTHRFGIPGAAHPLFLFIPLFLAAGPDALYSRIPVGTILTMLEADMQSRVVAGVLPLGVHMYAEAYLSEWWRLFPHLVLTR